MGHIDSSFLHLFSSANGRATLQNREDARREGRGDRASRVKAAFEKALFVYPNEHLEMRQGARIILKSKVEPPPNLAQ
jgi:hypothetical protein